MSKLIVPIEDKSNFYFCDIKGCRNPATHFILIQGLRKCLNICKDCKKKLYEQLKQEVNNELSKYDKI